MATVIGTGDIAALLQLDENHNLAAAEALAYQLARFEDTLYWIDQYIFLYNAYTPIEWTSTSFSAYIELEPVNGQITVAGTGLLGSSGSITQMRYDGNDYNWEISGRLLWSLSQGIYSGTITTLSLWNESDTERFTITIGPTNSITATYNGITSIEKFTLTTSGDLSKYLYLSYADAFGNQISIDGAFVPPPNMQTLGDLFDTPGIFAGNDTFRVEDGSRPWYGFAGNDLMIGGDPANTFYGGAGNDSLYGMGGDDFLYGEAGADLLDGGEGADLLSGGNGDDTYFVDDPGDLVVELPGEGVDTVRATLDYVLPEHVENLVLTGSAALSGTGNALNNTLTGNDGDNLLDGGAGVDRLSGGKGDDTYIVDLILKGTGTSTSVALQDTVSEASGAGTDTLRLRGAFETGLTTTLVLGATLENLDASQTGTTRLNLTGNALANRLIGNDGDNLLDGKAGVDTYAGGAGNDTYVLDNRDELARIDEAEAAGNDTLRILYGNSLSTPLVVDLGTAGLLNVENVVLVGSGRFDLLGNDLDNVLIGNASPNTLRGGAGNDLLDGKAGADILYGGAGDDTYVVDNPLDLVGEDADEGTDTVRASLSWKLASNLEILALTGTSAINATGNELDNSLLGNSAANLLDGGLGADQMSGGKGNDTYVVDDPGDLVVELPGEGVDTVRATLDYVLPEHVENLVLTGSAALSGTGNALNNTLTGNDGDNLLDGAAGVDRLNGGKGDDTYIVDLILKGTGTSTSVALQDTVSEASGAGTDTLRLRGAFETGLTTTLVLGANLENLDASQTGTTRLNLTGNALANRLIGNDGDNLLDGKAGIDTFAGGAGNDTYVLDNRAELDLVMEVADHGNDTLRIAFNNATNTPQIIDLGSGGLPLLGSDALTGSGLLYPLRGVLNEYLTGAMLGASTSANATPMAINLDSTGLSNVENVTITGSGLFDVLGNDLDNVLIGNASPNTLRGGAGNDLLDGKAGADILYGGAGDDTYVVDNPLDLVGEDADEGTDTVRASLSWKLASNLEILVLTGTSAINATGNELDNTLLGNSAANLLDGGLGADQMSGGKGNDTYVVDDPGDLVVELPGEGVDTVRATLDYVLPEHVENLVLTGSAALSGTGNALNNTLTGNDGDNLLDGGAGVDRLNGGKGDDTYIVDLILKGTGTSTSVALQDTVSEASGAGTDTLRLRGTFETGLTTTLVLGANLENLDASQTGTTRLNLTGNALANRLIGNDGDNLLSGGAGNDELNGGAGDDLLIGGAGADRLLGGSGRDTFRFAALTDLGLGERQDEVADFENGLDKLDFRSLGGYTFVGDAEFTGAKQLRIESAADGLLLYGNTNTDLANAEFSIKLTGLASLSAEDLLL